MTVTSDNRAAMTRRLLWSAVAVAAVTFTLSFYGLNDFARESMKLPVFLSWIVPAGLDGLTVVAIIATFLLRHEPWHVRAYAWLVFSVAAVLSMAGNHQHAVNARLDDAGTAGFTAAPVILALAAHLVVVTWRHLERAVRRSVTPDTAASGDPDITPDSRAAVTPDATGPGESPEPGPVVPPDGPDASGSTVTDIRRPRRRATRRGVAGRQRGDTKAAKARELAGEGLTRPEIAKRLRVSERTVFRYLGATPDNTPDSPDRTATSDTPQEA